MIEFDILQLSGDQLNEVHKVAIWQLLTGASPDAVPTAEEVEDVYSTSMLCHEETDCVWLFLRVWDKDTTEQEDRRESMIGVAAGAPRSNGSSFYIFNLVVRSAYRRKGCGEKLVRECQALAASRGCCKLSGSVASREKGLQRWYERLGARFVQDFVSSDGQLPPSIRMEGGFEGQDHHAALAACNERLRKSLNTHEGNQRADLMRRVLKQALPPLVFLAVAKAVGVFVARRTRRQTA